MWDDRVRPEPISVTHEFLLLGVRRPGLTDTMNDLEARGFTRSSRGKVLLLNREDLKLATDGFYGIPEAEYDRALATSSSVSWAGRHSPLIEFYLLSESGQFSATDRALTPFDQD
jgi:hypothetical protein